VATARLILLKGHAGMIVATFGGFVVGGNVVVGLVIFLILVIIQFVVITKGAGRVSEVAARFTLDAMPGKQVAIDAELNPLALAAALGYGARRLGTRPPPATEGKDQAAAARPPAEVHLEDFLLTDRACVEIGARLIPLVDPKRGAGLLDRIGGLRRDLARKS